MHKVLYIVMFIVGVLVFFFINAIIDEGAEWFDSDVVLTAWLV